MQISESLVVDFQVVDMAKRSLVTAMDAIQRNELLTHHRGSFWFVRWTVVLGCLGGQFRGQNELLRLNCQCQGAWAGWGKGQKDAR